MLFNSHAFIFLFLPAMLLGWWSLVRWPTARLGFLTLMSYVFYVLFDFPTGLKLLPLLLFSTVVDYVAGRRIHAAVEEAVRKRWLLVSLVMNLGLLCFFKYLGFFEQIADGVLGVFGRPGTVPVHDIILPLGISFYTFNSMSYTIDIYRRQVQPARSLVHYASFVALFPHLVAGPIVRWSDVGDQLRGLPRRFTSQMAYIGLLFFSVGLFKKLVIADALLSVHVDRLFANSADLALISAAAAVVGYALQLYFDFSAYSEMAVGLAMFMGLRYPQNFNSPFRAKDMGDFWRRWHMTLGGWIKDYLFIPLGGSRGSLPLVCRNVFITFFLVGFWHGAAWTFVLFGVGHGLAMVAYQVRRSRGWKPLSPVTARFNTFAIWALLAVFIKAPTLESSMQVLSAVFGANGLGLGHLGAAEAGAGVPLDLLALLAALFLFVNVAPNVWELSRRPLRRPRLAGVALAGAAAAGVLTVAAPSPFLYFQF